MKLLFVVPIFWLTGVFVPENADLPSGKERNKYHFTQAWVWQYQNDWIAPGEPGHRGEITIYHDSLTRSWLYDGEAFGTSGEGFDFILGGFDGRYTFCFQDEKGKKRKAIRNIGEVFSSRNDNQSVKQEFDLHHKQTDRTKVFGRNIYGWPELTGREYSKTYLKTTEKTMRYLADSNTDFQSVVYFNFIEGEVQLPVHFPTDIPLGMALLEDSTVYADGKKIILRLKEISDTEYHIDLSKYK